MSPVMPRPYSDGIRTEYGFISSIWNEMLVNYLICTKRNRIAIYHNSHYFRLQIFHTRNFSVTIFLSISNILVCAVLFAMHNHYYW